jgi:hypothetical protein
MKNLQRVLIIAIVLFCSYEIGFAQASLTIGSVFGTPNSTISVPVQAAGISNMAGFQFTITYNKNLLTYVNCSNWSGGASASDVQITLLDGKITFVYNEENSLINIISGRFFDLNFKVNTGTSGSAIISWSDVPTQRELSNNKPEIIPCTYNNGSITIQDIAVVPSVTTSTVLPTSPNTATGGGSITSDGGAPVTDRGLCWSTSLNPTIANLITSDGTGTGAFTSAIAGLSGGVTYHARAYAKNSAGTGYGSDVSFTTPQNQVITVTSPNIESIWYTKTSHSITWTDNISENVNIYLYKGDNYIASITSSAASNGSFNWTISSELQPGNDYRVCIVSSSNNAIKDFSDSFTLAIQPENCPDSYEPDNTLNAPAINAFSSLGTSVYYKTSYGTIHNTTDKDYYQLNITSPGHITIEMANPPADFDLMFYNQAGEILKTSSTNNSESIDYDILSSGFYTILVVGKNSSYSCSLYTLNLNWQPMGCIDAYEPNDTPDKANITLLSEANNTSMTKSIQGTIYPQDDYDFFKINITKPGTLNVSLNNPPANYCVQLYDANNKFIGIKYANDNKSWTITTLGYYYIIVGSYPDNEFSCSSYTINVTWTPTSGPLLQVSPAKLDFGSLLVNSNSGNQVYNLQGANLTGNIIVSGPEGFQVSSSPGGPFLGSINVVPSNGNVNTSVYVRFSPVTAKSYSGNVSNTSSGAPTVNVAVTGIGNNCLDGYEPNDDIPVANTSVFESSFGNAAFTKTIYGTVYPAEDYDFYRINVVNPGTLDVNLINPPADYTIQICDVNRNSMGIKHSYEQKNWTLTNSGYYFIIVSSYPGTSSSCTTYNLKVDWAPAYSCKDAYEPNNTVQNATSSLINTLGAAVYSKSITGTIDDIDDWDIFKLNITTTGTLSVVMNNPPANIDIELDDHNQTWITGSHTSGNESFNYSVTSPGTYYFMVSNYYQVKSCNNYQVNLTWNPGTFCTDDYEPNNSSGFANEGAIDNLGLLSFTKLLYGTIHAPDDWDMFRISNTAEGTLTLVLDNPPKDYRLELLRENREIISFSSTNGTEKIVQKLIGEGDYFIKLISTNGEFSCNEYSLKIDWNTRVDQIITFNPLLAVSYGAVDFIPGAYSNSGLPITYTSDNSYVATIVDGKIHITGAGICNITASQPGNQFYTNAKSVSQLLTVNKANLTATAINTSRGYGLDNPEFLVSFSGFMNFENSTILDVLPIPGTSAGKNSSPGDYPIILSGGSDNNYNITLVPGTLFVTKGNVIATAENKSKVYGSENPIFTIRYDGFVNGENSAFLDYLPYANTVADNRFQVGSYLINLEGGIDNNYNIFLVNGYLNISKAMVSVIAENKTKMERDENPELTFHYAGFVNDDDKEVIDLMPEINCVANASSSAGEYPITLSGGYDNNYEFLYINGILTVNEYVTSAIDNNESIVCIYPNPANDEIRIKVGKLVPEKVLIEIADLKGHLVYDNLFVDLDQNVILIDISELQPGIYTVTIKAGQQSKVQKIVKY